MSTATKSTAYGAATQTILGLVSGENVQTFAYAGGINAQNFLINGAFDFWQRGTSFSTNGGYTADRWWCSIAAGTGTFERIVDTSTVSGYVLRVSRTSATLGTLLLNQSLETANVKPLAGKTITLSIKAKRNSSLTTGVILSATWGTGTDEKLPTGGMQSETTYLSANISTVNYTTLSHTFTLPSNATSLRIRIGGDSVLGEWPNGSTLDIAECMLNIGSQPAPFSRAGGTIGGELLLCQRYYYRWVPAAIGSRWGAGYGFNATIAYTFLQFPVPMRSIPASIETSGTITDYVLAIAGNNNLAVNSIAAAGVDTTGITISVGAASGIPVGAGLMGRAASTNAYLGFNAEL